MDGIRMDLESILNRFREEIDLDDSIRERVLPISREAVRRCSEAIKHTHRGNFDEAKTLIEKAHSLVVEGKKEIENSKFLMGSRVFDTAYQELAEASNLLSILQDNTFTPPEKFEIPSRAYMTGLADTVGELRRATLDSIRDDNVERAEEMLSTMVRILEVLVTFDYPNALIPDLRRKCDIARSLVERTRGDVTTAIQTTRLVRELRAREKPGSE
jgi:translin